MLPAAQNTCFFCANRFSRFTQECLMVEPDTGNNRNVGIDCIKGIQPSSQSDLENRHIHVLFCNAVQGSQRTELKVGQRHITAGCINGLEGIANLFIARFIAVQTNSLIKSPNVWRQRATYAISTMK